MKQVDLDDIAANPSGQQAFNELVHELAGRRRFIKTGVGASVLGFLGLGAGNSKAHESVKANSTPSYQFESVAANSDDMITLPPGYEYQVINRWGDPLFADAPKFKGDASEGASAQERQIGYNHDGLHFFPIDAFGSVPGEQSREGLLVTNHEYITPHFFFPAGVVPGESGWNADWVRKSQLAHGASVLHVRLNQQQRWEPILDSPFNRNINATTPMRLVGPAAGHALMKTSADTDASQVLGTFGNCGNGFTLWNTYLTCEENFTDYFGIGSKDKTQAAYLDPAQQDHLQRYKGGSKDSGKAYRWDTHDSRFDWTIEPNESNRFGWIVEIDPFDPHSIPKKLTALGRFKHENAAMTLSNDQRVVVYMGDDQRSEYIYKFVSDGRYDPDQPARNRLLLDKGILYVAKFSSETSTDSGLGTGQWIPLALDTPTIDGKTLGAIFTDMGELLIKTRQAADAVGATPMDRPEWVAVHPKTREVYVTLTNNADRGAVDKQRWPKGPTHPAIDAANPRAANLYGQIVRWREQEGDPAQLVFEWDVFALAGNPHIHPPAHPQAGTANITPENAFNSPDGLAFDKEGRLWIQTDGDYSNEGPYQGHGNNQMLIADPSTKRIKRFMVGPKGCEVTGITWTPDQRYVFVNIQHPGEGMSVSDSQTWPTRVSTWPDGPKASRPRPATVVIWRTDLGVVGA